MQPDRLLLQIVAERADHFADDRIQGEGGPADFARPGVIDELIQLGSHPIRLVDDIAGFLPHL